MQETVYPTLASSYDYYHRTGKVAAARRQPPGRAVERAVQRLSRPRTAGSRSTSSPRGIGRTCSGDGARGTAGRSALRRPTPTRIAHMDETDAVVAEWTRDPAARWRSSPLPSAAGSPCAPVRNAAEVMNDPHMHERGMLEWIDHPELGRVMVPNSPLRLHGAARPPTRPSPALGSTTRRSMATGSACRRARSPRCGKTG